MNRVARSIAETCIVKGDVTLSSGRQSTRYYDVKRWLMQEGDHGNAAWVGNAILQSLCDGEWLGDIDHKDLRLVFLELGGVLMMPGFEYNPALAHPPLFWSVLRKERQDHGMESLWINQPPVGAKVVLLDDVATTGGSLVRAVGVCHAAGLEVLAAVVVVDRLEGAEDLLSHCRVPLFSLCTGAELLQAQGEELK